MTQLCLTTYTFPSLFRKALETACPASLIRIIEIGYTILAAFAKLRKAAISIVTSYLPSVHTEQLFHLNGFSWNLIRVFKKKCREILFH